jgi:hypothetical protein
MQEEDSVNQPYDSQLYYELEKHYSHTLKLLFGSLARPEAPWRMEKVSTLSGEPPGAFQVFGSYR